MLVSPTPGSSGTAEFVYQELHGAALGDYTLITAILWRGLTSYYYLVMGAVLLPQWIRRVLIARKKDADKHPEAAEQLELGSNKALEEV